MKPLFYIKAVNQAKEVDQYPIPCGSGRQLRKFSLAAHAIQLYWVLAGLVIVRLSLLWHAEPMKLRSFHISELLLKARSCGLLEFMVGFQPTLSPSKAVLLAPGFGTGI